MMGMGMKTRCEGGIGGGERNVAPALETPSRKQMSICPVVGASAVGVTRLYLLRALLSFLSSPPHSHTHTHKILTITFVTLAIIAHTCFSDGSVDAD